MAKLSGAWDMTTTIYIKYIHPDTMPSQVGLSEVKRKQTNAKISGIRSIAQIVDTTALNRLL